MVAELAGERATETARQAAEAAAETHAEPTLEADAMRIIWADCTSAASTMRGHGMQGRVRTWTAPTARTDETLVGSTCLQVHASEAASAIVLKASPRRRLGVQALPHRLAEWAPRRARRAPRRPGAPPSPCLAFTP